MPDTRRPTVAPSDIRVSGGVQLGDTLGLTPVHVNRVLQDFRRRKLISLGHGILELLDVEGLQATARFNKDYLHLGGAPAEVVRYFDQLEDEFQRDRAV